MQVVHEWSGAGSHRLLWKFTFEPNILEISFYLVSRCFSNLRRRCRKEVGSEHIVAKIPPLVEKRSLTRGGEFLPEPLLLGDFGAIQGGNFCHGGGIFARNCSDNSLFKTSRTETGPCKTFTTSAGSRRPALYPSRVLIAADRPTQCHVGTISPKMCFKLIYN